MAVSSSDARQAVTAVLQALSKWQDEFTAANERGLAQVLDQTSVAARAVGWPEHVINATRDQLLSATKVQTQLIDQVTVLWEKQLETSTAPKAAMRNPFHMPRLPSSNVSGSMPAMFGIGGQPLAPMLFWMQAAEMWQRNWLSAMSLWADSFALLNPEEDRINERSRSTIRH